MIQQVDGQYKVCDCEEGAEYRRKRSEAVEAEDKRFEQQRKDEYKKKLLAQSGLPLRFQDITLEKTESPPRWLPKYINSPMNKWLYLGGEVGVGKTHLMAVIANHLLEKGTPFIWGGVLSLLGKVQATFSNNESATKVIDDLSNVEILFIDDLGKEKVSAWVEQTLFLVVDSRYNNFKTTIITSNFSPDELQDKYPNVGDALISRLAEVCAYIKIEGKDRRRK